MSPQLTHRPLLGRRIMVTRPTHLAHDLAQSLEQQGATVVRFPCLEIIAVEQTQAMCDKAKQLERYKLIVFISQNAVDYGMELLRQVGCSQFNIPVAAVGIKTAQALARAGIDSVVHPMDAMSSEALAETEQLKSIKQGAVLIFRGRGGNQHLATQLQAQGVRVDYLEVYRRRCPQTSLQFSTEFPPPDLITVASAQTLKNLHNLAVPESLATLLEIPVVVGSARMEQVCRQLGFRNKPLVAHSPLDDDMLQAVLRWQELHRLHRRAL